MHKSKKTIQNFPQDQRHTTKNKVKQIQHLQPLSLVPRNFQNLAITKPPNFRSNTVQSPIQH